MAEDDLLTRLHLWYAGHGPPALASLLVRVHPEVVALEPDGECWRLETGDGAFFLSDPRQVVRVVGLGVDMRGRVYEKYTAREFVEVEPGDVVVDVGAFIGEFSMVAADVAGRVIAVEPDGRNFAALTANLGRLEHATAVNRAVWNETGPASFNVAGDPSEGSVLDLDSSSVTDVATIDAVRIDDLVGEFGVTAVDLLKVEAEGAEPEVLDGVGELPVAKVAVECSPERDGRSPAPEVRDWLSSRGYEVQTRGDVVFGMRR